MKRIERVNEMEDASEVTPVETETETLSLSDRPPIKGPSVADHINRAAGRFLHVCRAKAVPVAPEPANASGIACPVCKTPVAGVPGLKRHMTDEHDGFTDADIARAAAPGVAAVVDDKLPVSRAILKKFCDAHDELKAEIAKHAPAPVAPAPAKRKKGFVV